MQRGGCVDDDFGRRENIMELFHNQVTRGQGVASFRFHHRSFGLYFLAENVDADVTVLEFPTKERFERELRNGYDIVQYLKRAWEATKNPEDFAANCKWIRENPHRGVCGMIDMKAYFSRAWLSMTIQHGQLGCVWFIPSIWSVL